MWKCFHSPKICILLASVEGSPEVGLLDAISGTLTRTSSAEP